MSILPVTKPEASKQQGMGQLSAILRMIPTPWTQGAATALQFAQGVQDEQASTPTPSAEPVKSSSFDNGAMGRRKEMMAVDHGTELKSAISAIDSSDWDMERKKQLRAPIEQALYKGGYV